MKSLVSYIRNINEEVPKKLKKKNSLRKDYLDNSSESSFAGVGFGAYNSPGS